MSDPEKLWLGGRAFRYAAGMTVRQDLFCMMHARHAGLVGAKRHEGESPEEFMGRLMDLLLSSGRALLLMGGLLIPFDEIKWSVLLAEETAEFLGEIADPAEKQKLYVELASALLAFFRNGLGSWIGSASSSQDSGRMMTNETSPSAIGETSSIRSANVIPAGSAGSLT